MNATPEQSEIVHLEAHMPGELHTFRVFLAQLMRGVDSGTPADLK